ncbi:MAG TPA: GGDEF domain-containing protein [bacterium]|nr:GGDEF domain-containing protein [bacterium]
MTSSLLTLADLMSTTAFTISGRDTVASAIRILREQRRHVLPVAVDDQFVGVVTAFQLLGEAPDRPIAELMQSGIEPGTPNMLPSEGHRLLTRHGLDLLPVTENGRVVGVVSSAAILGALNQQTDSLTGLPWAVLLRTWARDALLEEREIAILFIDLDNFWLVNKVNGHVAGDDCLRAVARCLMTCVDRRHDLLCRYGGDEFAIGTTRRGAELEALARRVREAVDVSCNLKGLPHRVRGSVGVAGGRRVASRAATHIASLVEDLIAQASMGSTLAKGSERWETTAARTLHPGTAPMGTRPREARCRLVDVVVAPGDQGHPAATVTLELGRRLVKRTTTVNRHTRDLDGAVAASTLGAIMDLMGPGHTFSVHDHRSVSAADGTRIAVVIVQSKETLERWVGAAIAARGVDAAARATLDAVNRRIARGLGDLLRLQVSKSAAT